jgi:phage tail-like protein
MTSFRTLTVSFGGQVLMTSTLSKFPYAIGELPNNDLPLPQISPSHAQIEIISGRAFLTDLGSQRGTLVGGVPLQPHQPMMLVDGVTIRIGPYDIVYRSAIDQAEDAAVPVESHVLEESPQVLDADDAFIDPAFRRVRTPATENGDFAIGRYLPSLPVIFHDSEGDTLAVSHGDRVLLTETLTKSPYRIGELPANDLSLSQLSPSHAEIRIVAGRAFLKNLAGHEDTSVAGVPLQRGQSQVLDDGVTVHLGPYEIVYRAAPFVTRFLKIFESIWEPLEQRQDYIDMYFSPRTCPSSWLPWFASWFGLELDPSLSERQVRMLLANTIEIYRWRGTKYGLRRVIEVCLGIRPVITESRAEPNVFRVKVRLPKDATPDFVPRLRALISAHKPAHTGYVIEVQK